MTQKRLPTHSRPHACQILPHRQSLLNSSSQMSPEYCSAFTVLSHPLSPQGCAAQTSRLPRPSALPRLSIPQSQFPLLLIIPSRSDSQSSQFCFSKTEIPAVTKQVYQSNSLYFCVLWSWRKIATSDCSLKNHKQGHEHGKCWTALITIWNQCKYINVIEAWHELSKWQWWHRMGKFIHINRNIHQKQKLTSVLSLSSLFFLNWADTEIRDKDYSLRLCWSSSEAEGQERASKHLLEKERVLGKWSYPMQRGIYISHSPCSLAWYGGPTFTELLNTHSPRFMEFTLTGKSGGPDRFRKMY